MTRRQERRLRTVADLVMKHGIAIKDDGSGKLVPNLPKVEFDLEGKELLATGIVKVCSTAKPSFVRQVIRAVRKGNAMFEAQERVISEVRGTVLEVERGAALVTLLNRGLDADPMFTRVAAAKDADEVRRVMAGYAPVGVR